MGNDTFFCYHTSWSTYLSEVACLPLPPPPCSAGLVTTIQTSCLLRAWAGRGGGGLSVWELGPALVPPPEPGSGEDLQEGL